MTAHLSYREIVNNSDYELDDYPRSAWRQEVQDGLTILGYGESVGIYLEEAMRQTRLPEPLRQFVVRNRVTRATALKWLEPFLNDGHVVYRYDYSRVYVTLTFCFESLTPFSVWSWKDNNMVAVIDDARKEPPEMNDAWDLLYQWDAQLVPDFTELVCP